MFSADKKEKKIMEPTTNQNRINEGTLIKGNIESQGFFRIDGTVEGNINTPSKVVLGKSGKIIGTLMCKDADIEGSFDGNLDVSGTLSLKASAKIDGEVVVGKLAVEPGADFNATCVMKGSEKDKPKASVSTEAISKEPSKDGSPYDRQNRLKKSTEPLK